MKAETANKKAGLIRGPMGGLIGASIGCSAWQIRGLADAQGAGMVPWLILALLFLVSVALSPIVAYYGLVARRWSGTATLIAFAASLIATDALFLAARYLLVGGNLFQDRLYLQAIVIAAAILAGLLLFSPIRTRIAKNFEDWRDSR